MRHGNNLRRNPKKMLATESRQYAYIQEAARTDDGRGGIDTVWVNAHPSPHSMAILPLSALQVQGFKSINVEATHFIKIRAEIPIIEENRILYGSRIFEILTIEDIQERGIVNWVFCKERRT